MPVLLLDKEVFFLNVLPSSPSVHDTDVSEVLTISRTCFTICATPSKVASESSIFASKKTLFPKVDFRILQILSSPHLDRFEKWNQRKGGRSRNRGSNKIIPDQTKSLHYTLLLFFLTHSSSINCFTVCRSCGFHCNIFLMRGK